MKISLLLTHVFEIMVYAAFILAGWTTMPYINPALFALPSSFSFVVTINYWGFLVILASGFAFITLIGAFFDGVRNSLNSK